MATDDVPPVVGGKVDKSIKIPTISNADNSELEIPPHLWPFLSSIDAHPSLRPSRIHPTKPKKEETTEGEGEYLLEDVFHDCEQEVPPSIHLLSSALNNNDVPLNLEDAASLDDNTLVKGRKGAASLAANPSPTSVDGTALADNPSITSTKSTKNTQVAISRARSVSAYSNPNSRKYFISGRIRKSTITDDELKTVSTEVTTMKLLQFGKFEGEIIGETMWRLRMAKRKTKHWWSSGGHNELCVSSTIEKYGGLAEITKRHKVFGSLLEGMLNNNLYFLPSSTGKLTLANITAKQASIIGMKFSNSLRSRGISDAGTQHWISKHRALTELNEKYPFFLSMCNIIGQRKLHEALWGEKFRLYSGAALVLVDTGTDFFAAYKYFVEGRDNYAWALLAFILVSVCSIQLIVVLLQNANRGMDVIAYECAIVLIQIKAPIAARRIASGNIKQEGSFLIAVAVATNDVKRIAEFPSHSRIHNHTAHSHHLNFTSKNPFFPPRFFTIHTTSR